MNQRLSLYSLERLEQLSLSDLSLDNWNLYIIIFSLDLFSLHFCLLVCFYKRSMKAVSGVFYIIPLKLSLISLGAQLNHSIEHLGTFWISLCTIYETIVAILWLVSSSVFPVKGSNFESNEPSKWRHKPVNTYFLSVWMDMNCSCPYLYCFLYLNISIQHILSFHFSTYSVSKSSMETKDISAKEKKKSEHSSMFNQVCMYSLVFC